MNVYKLKDSTNAKQFVPIWVKDSAGKRLVNIKQYQAIGSKGYVKV